MFRRKERRYERAFEAFSKRNQEALEEELRALGVDPKDVDAPRDDTTDR